MVGPRRSMWLTIPMPAARRRPSPSMAPAYGLPTGAGHSAFGPGITAMGANGATDGSTDGTITFTADTSGDPGVVTSETFTYNDAWGHQQSFPVSLSNGGTASFDVAYDPNAGGPSQTITIDGATLRPISPRRSW